MYMCADLFVCFVFLGVGDVLIQISETQRRLTAEMEGVVSTAFFSERH